MANHGVTEPHGIEECMKKIIRNVFLPALLAMLMVTAEPLAVLAAEGPAEVLSGAVAEAPETAEPE